MDKFRFLKKTLDADSQSAELKPEPAGMAMPPPQPYEIAAWIAAGVTLFLVLWLHLLTALLSGLLVYELVHLLVPVLHIGRMTHRRAKLVVVALLASIIVALLAMLIWKAMHFLHSASISTLLQKMAEIIDGLKFKLPDWLVQSLPAGSEDLRADLVQWMRTHARDIQSAGKEAGIILAQILMGMVIGAIISLGDVTNLTECRPLGCALLDRVSRFRVAFHAIVFAQVRISFLNSLLVLIYLAGILPLFGIRLPLVKTMVVITFVVCLVPIIGNIISNIVIVVISLSHSFGAAVASLVFLVLIHKLEYFLNASIVGSRIRSHAWELLLAMLVMESAFGIPGLIAAPIYYAYVKSELTDRGLV